MTLKLKSMDLWPGAVSLSNMSAEAQQLINHIIQENNAGAAPYANHTDNRDPMTNGGKCGTGVAVYIYYMPATQFERNNGEAMTVTGAQVWVSRRKRLAARKEGGAWSFFTTNHPLNSNDYGTYTPINPKK